MAATITVAASYTITRDTTSETVDRLRHLATVLGLIP